MKGSDLLISFAPIGSSDKGGFEELKEIIGLSISLILLESGDRNNLLSSPSPISFTKRELMDFEKKSCTLVRLGNRTGFV